jgi:hypothetical protein
MKKTETILLVVFALLLTLDMLLLLFLTHCFSGQEWGWTGDAVGGIIGTVVSGIAVIAVFLAYREQIKANKALFAANSMLEVREDRRLILEQIKLLEEIDFRRRSKMLVSAIREPATELDAEEVIVKAYYCVSELELTTDLILKYKGANKDTLVRKLRNVYEDNYLLKFYEIEAAGKLLTRHKYAADIEQNISGLLLRISQIRDRIASIEIT